LKRKETFWLIGTISFVLILILGIFGIDGLKSDAVTDINVHDTYYVIANIHLISPFISLTFFGIYLIRMLRRNFKNLTANLIFMISDITLILIFTFLISLVNSIREIPGSTEYPPLSGGIVENAGNGWNNAYYILLIIQLILIILLTISGIKTGLNYKRTE
jgi:heme/copper-type cytochrome/quinol oxidase subunit 1